MKPDLIKGELVKWNDERGFGFIKPSSGGETVFLHISAVKTTGRRPSIGDTIFYRRTTGADGRVRAADAAIQGVVSRTANTRPRQTRRTTRSPDPLALIKIFVGLAIALSAGISSLTSSMGSRGVQTPPSAAIGTQPDTSTEAAQASCMIKGNISVSSGRRLYHVPGMQDYDITRINLSEGERWFCSEAEAQAAGWVRAPM
ncbi:MAG: cold shock domain-containing protein [Cyanobacteria bacterium J069]|nr:MAG: cold shock domain-containing protein [Cyanobacteria bacterium J069]